MWRDQLEYDAQNEAEQMWENCWDNHLSANLREDFLRAISDLYKEAFLRGRDMS